MPSLYGGSSKMMGLFLVLENTMFLEIIQQAQQAVTQWQAELPADHPDKVSDVAYQPRMAALVMRYLLRIERMTGTARLAYAWQVARNRTWESTDGTFETFEAFWEYCCQDEELGIGRYSTTWSLTLNFATKLAPWLSSHRLETDDGAHVTPEYLLEHGGFGKLGDVQTAWNMPHRRLETLRHELTIGWPAGDLPDAEMHKLIEATREVDHIITACVKQVLNPTVTREGLDEYLKEKGWRQSRQPTAAQSWRWAAMSGTEEVLFVVLLPRMAFDFVRRLLGKWLSLAPEKPEAILPQQMDVERDHAVPEV